MTSCLEIQVRSLSHMLEMIGSLFKPQGTEDDGLIR
jgi:hypothetical protein